MANQFVKYLLIFLVTSEVLVLDILGQLETAPQLSSDSNAVNNKETQVNYELHQPHHIVKRKSKGGFGFGRKKGSSSKPKNSNRDPYPKQPGHNPAYPQQPAYNPSYNPGAPPAYPGTNSRPGYPAGPPPAYPGTNSRPGYPAGPPPAYPGTGGHHNMPAYPPAYPGHSQPGCMN